VPVVQNGKSHSTSEQMSWDKGKAIAADGEGIENH